MRFSQRPLGEKASFFFIVLLFGGLSAGPFGQIWAWPVLKAVCAFNAEDEGEPILYLLGYVIEKIILIFLRHFGLAIGAKPKHIPSQFLLRGGLKFLGRLLPFGADHIHLQEEKISFYFIIMPVVGKYTPTLVDFLYSNLSFMCRDPLRLSQYQPKSTLMIELFSIDMLGHALGYLSREFIEQWPFPIGQVRAHHTRTCGTWGSVGRVYIRSGLYAEREFYHFPLSML